MEDDYYVSKDWDEIEDDFINKRTNIYAKINSVKDMGGYYMKVKHILPEEISALDEVFSFYYCRITKTKEYVLKETRISKRYIVSEKTILASEFVENNLTNNETYGAIEEELIERGDYYLCFNSYKDEDGDLCKIFKPRNKDEEIVNKPKILRLEN